MNNLNISETVQSASSGDHTFSAEKVRGQFFGGLMDPVTGFDHFKLSSDVFGPHPHAGMSALSYLFEDSVPYHNLDSIGTDIRIEPGSLMWTWAGRGVVHTEYPVPDGSEVHGLQLFINMPANKKQSEPSATYLPAAEIPEIIRQGVRVRVLSGSSNGIKSPAVFQQDITFLHLFLSGNDSFTHHLPPGWNGTVYMVNGTAALGISGEIRLLKPSSTVCFSSSDVQEVSFSTNGVCEIIFISGQPLKEQIYTKGSLSMSSNEELEKTINDYQQGYMGYIKVENGARKVILPTLR